MSKMAEMSHPLFWVRGDSHCCDVLYRIKSDSVNVHQEPEPSIAIQNKQCDSDENRFTPSFIMSEE